MKKNLSLLIGILSLMHGASFGQTAAIKSIQAKKIALSQKKFEDPMWAKASFLQILSDNPSLPDSITYGFYQELAVCYGMMHQFDSGIYFTKKAIALVPKNDNPVLLLKTLANLYSMSNQPKSSDSCFKMALQLCDQLKIAPLTKVLVLGDYATYYYNKSNYIKSIQLLSEAVSLNRSIANIDSNRTALLREKMANIYLDTKNFAFAEKMYLLNLDYLSSKQQSLQLANNYTGLAEAYQGSRQFTPSSIYFTKGLGLYNSLNNPTYANYCLMNLAENQLLDHKAGEARATIQQAFEAMSASNALYLLEAATIYLKILEATQNKTAAIQVMQNQPLQQALASNYSEEALAYHNASLPFLTSNELINTLHKIIIIKDSVNDGAKRKEMVEIEAKYQLSVMEHDGALLVAKNKILAQKNELANTQLLAYLLVGILLATLFIYWALKTKEKTELHKTALHIKTQENENLLLDAESHSQERLVLTKIIKNQEINILQHIEKMQALEQQIENATEKNLGEEQNNLIAQLEKLKTGNEHLELFMAKFNTIYPKFCTTLVIHYPKLSNSDVLFCALNRMSLSSKEIASIINIEQSSFYKRKYRIAEKMGLTDVVKFNDTLFSLD